MKFSSEIFAHVWEHPVYTCIQIARYFADSENAQRLLLHLKRWIDASVMEGEGNAIDSWQDAPQQCVWVYTHKQWSIRGAYALVPLSRSPRNYSLIICN